MSAIRADMMDFTALLDSALTPRERPRIEAQCRAAFGAGSDAEIAALLDLVLNRDLAAADRIAAAGHDRLYLEALTALVAETPLQGGAATPRAARRVQWIDQRHDFFHAIRDDRDWSTVRFMNFWARSKIAPRRRIAAVTSIRNEGINLIEWIAHHRLLGIDDFIIYANDNDDGSSALLTLLAEHGVIHLIWNDVDIGKDGRSDMFPIQAKCFGHASEFLPEARDFQWLLFIDLDEFLVTQAVMQAPTMPRPLDDLFARLAAMERLPGAVAFNWKWFTSLCEYGRRPELIFERFNHWCGNDHVKTMARGDRCIAFRTSHMPHLAPGEIVLNGALQPAAPGYMMKLTYGYGQINHYFNKSFEEFVGKHCGSGATRPSTIFSKWAPTGSGTMSRRCRCHGLRASMPRSNACRTCRASPPNAATSRTPTARCWRISTAGTTSRRCTTSIFQRASRVGERRDETIG